MKKENPYLDQLNRKYSSYLGSLITGEEFFPIRLRGGIGKPTDTKQLYKSTDDFLEFEKKEGKPGWMVEWENWTSKKLGAQRWPSSITVESEEDYLHILGKNNEAEQFKYLIKELLDWQPGIRHWLAGKPQRVLEFAAQWEQLKKVVDYVKDRDLSDYYLRSIPVPVHTKFIKQNESVLLSLLKQIAPDKYQPELKNITQALGVKPKPELYPVRWLDPAMAARYTSGIVNLAVSSEDIRMIAPEIDEVWLVENETNLYLLQQRKNALALFSKGNALHLLAEVPFFKKVRLLYWGDLDEAGFLLLHHFRQLYPALESILMDEETLQHHQEGMHFINTGSVKMELNLTDTELAAYNFLRQTKGRIEQEQLDQAFIQRYLLEKGLGT